MGTLERFGLWESEGGWAARIEGIEGDTALKSLGLSNDHYQYLATGRPRHPRRRARQPRLPVRDALASHP